MNQMISFFMALIYSVINLLGISYTACDLKPTEMKSIEITQENAELFRNIFETETAWLASLQLENGAIPMTRSSNGDLRMSPYFADIAALALLDDADKYSENVKAYMDWHFAHINTAKEDHNGLDGTIYDYTITVKNNEIVAETSNGSYDSTDSYAATFITVLQKYYNKTGDADYIIAHCEEIKRITNVMFDTMNDGLTYATPDHKVKYLMDNCEVYEGFLAAADLFGNVISPVDATYIEFSIECADSAELVKKTINEALWTPVTNHYTPEMTYLGIHTKVFSWDRYYPCATSQLFPIYCGVIDPDTQRAEKLYNKFCETYDWESFDYPDDFYWGANVYTAALMNDLDSVLAYMNNYIPLMQKHSYPLYNADIARVSMAAYIMLEKAA